MEIYILTSTKCLCSDVCTMFSFAAVCTGVFVSCTKAHFVCDPLKPHNAYDGACVPPPLPPKRSIVQSHCAHSCAFENPLTPLLSPPIICVTRSAHGGPIKFSRVLIAHMSPGILCKRHNDVGT